MKLLATVHGFTLENGLTLFINGNISSKEISDGTSILNNNKK